jgi:hypothetical protein
VNIWVIASAYNLSWIFSRVLVQYYNAYLAPCILYRLPNRGTGAFHLIPVYTFTSDLAADVRNSKENERPHMLNPLLALVHPINLAYWVENNIRLSSPKLQRTPPSRTHPSHVLPRNLGLRHVCVCIRLCDPALIELRGNPSPARDRDGRACSFTPRMSYLQGCEGAAQGKGRGGGM